MASHERPEEKKDKSRPDFSNVESGSSSTAPAHGASAPSSRGRMYTVKEGDSLSKIAKREYGDASEWRRIFEANRNLIEDPDLIHPGQMLKIP
jgi:nucleoid-associated protein YgaU